MDFNLSKGVPLRVRLSALSDGSDAKGEHVLRRASGGRRRSPALPKRRHRRDAAPILHAALAQYLIFFRNGSFYALSVSRCFEFIPGKGGVFLFFLWFPQLTIRIFVRTRHLLNHEFIIQTASVAAVGYCHFSFLSFCENELWITDIDELIPESTAIGEVK